MDGLGHASHYARVRVLPHIKRLNDCFGDFVVRVSCPCGASRHIEALARDRRQIGDAGEARDADAVLTVREEGCRGGGGRAPEAARRRASMKGGRVPGQRFSGFGARGAFAVRWGTAFS